MSCSYDCQAESEYLEDKLKLELRTNISGLFAGSQVAFDCRSPTLIAGVKKRQRRRRRRCRHRHRRHRRLRGRCRKVENVLNQKVSFINQACQLSLSLSLTLSAFLQSRYLSEHFALNTLSSASFCPNL